MVVELDLQVSSPITGCTPSGGRVRPFAVRRCAPPRFLAAPTSFLPVAAFGHDCAPATRAGSEQVGHCPVRASLNTDTRLC